MPVAGGLSGDESGGGEEEEEEGERGGRRHGCRATPHECGGGRGDGAVGTEANATDR